jgi:hypothetical protein
MTRIRVQTDFELVADSHVSLQWLHRARDLLLVRVLFGTCIL